MPGKIIASSLHLENHWLISQLEDNTIRVWDLFQPGEKPKSVLTNQTLIEDWTRVFTNGKWFWMIGKDNSVQLWDLDHPDQKPESLSSVSKELYTIKISPGGNWLAVTNKRTVQVWDLRKSARESVLSFEADTDNGFGINAHNELLFSPDEHQLIVNLGTNIHILNLQDLAAEPVTLGGVIQEMENMALSADGHWLASNTAVIGEIRLWNLQDPGSAPIVLHQEESMNTFRFSPDGKWLAVADESNLRLLRLAISEVSNLACASMDSNLSRQQWKENFPAEKKYERTCSQWPEGKDKSVLITAG